QRKLSSKADVGQRNATSDERVPLRRQRLLESRGIDRERLFGSRVDARIDGAIRQREKLDLRIPCEDQAYVKKAVDHGGIIGDESVERECRLSEPRHHAHDAVRLEDPDLSVRSKRGRDVAERLSSKKGVGLEEFCAGQADTPSSGK